MENWVIEWWNDFRATSLSHKILGIFQHGKKLFSVSYWKAFQCHEKSNNQTEFSDVKKYLVIIFIKFLIKKIDGHGKALRSAINSR